MRAPASRCRTFHASIADRTCPTPPPAPPTRTHTRPRVARAPTAAPAAGPGRRPRYAPLSLSLSRPKRPTPRRSPPRRAPARVTECHWRQHAPLARQDASLSSARPRPRVPACVTGAFTDRGSCGGCGSGPLSHTQMWRHGSLVTCGQDLVCGQQPGEAWAGHERRAGRTRERRRREAPLLP